MVPGLHNDSPEMAGTMPFKFEMGPTRPRWQEEDLHEDVIVI